MCCPFFPYKTTYLTSKQSLKVNLMLLCRPHTLNKCFLANGKDVITDIFLPNKSIHISWQNRIIQTHLNLFIHATNKSHNLNLVSREVIIFHLTLIYQKPQPPHSQDFQLGTVALYCMNCPNTSFICSPVTKKGARVNLTQCSIFLVLSLWGEGEAYHLLSTSCSPQLNFKLC